MINVNIPNFKWIFTFEVINAPKIIDKTGGVKVVQGRETPKTYRIVMVAVDAEDWEADVHVRIGVIHVTIFQVAVGKIDCKQNITYVKFGCTVRIWNRTIQQPEFQMVQFSNGQALAMATIPAIQKPDHSKYRYFCPDFNWFWQNGGHLSRFQMVGFPDFRSRLKSGPFANQPLFNHLKSTLVRISVHGDMNSRHLNIEIIWIPEC